MSDPWALSWDALLAIATFGLALATVVVAWVTKGVANATADEVRAQNRPVLLPAEFEDEEAIAVREGEIRLRIRNGGKGPAFEVRSRLDPDGLFPDDWSHGILECDQKAELRFGGTPPEARDRYELLLSYRDLAGRDQSTTIVIKLIARRSGEVFRQAYAFQGVVPAQKAVVI